MYWLTGATLAAWLAANTLIIKPVVGLSRDYFWGGAKKVSEGHTLGILSQFWE